MRVWRAVAVLGAVLAAGCGASTSGSVSPVGLVSRGALPPGAFVAEYEHGSGDSGGGNGAFLSLFDERSGRHLRDLVHVPEGSQLRLAGFSRSAEGSITFAMARGPYYQSNVNGGDPRPGSCGGTVYRLDARSGLTTSLFTVGKDWTVRAPAASPDGSAVAYVSQACTAMFAARVVVRDLTSGHERHLSVAGASVTWVRWRHDGGELVFTLTYNTPSGSNVAGFVVVPAGADSEQPSSAVRHAPDRGCVVENAIFSGSDLQVVEACPDVITMPARLVQLAGDGPSVRWHADTHLCPNGMTVAHEPHGRLVVTGTIACGYRAGAPVDVVQMWSGRHVREVARYVNPQQFVSDAG